MTIWNYRVVQHTAGYCKIHEVEYDEELRPISMGPAFCPLAANAEELSHQMIHALSAFTRPILEYSSVVAPFTEDSAQTAHNLLRPKNV